MKKLLILVMLLSLAIVGSNTHKVKADIEIDTFDTSVTNLYGTVYILEMWIQVENGADRLTYQMPQFGYNINAIPTDTGQDYQLELYDSSSHYLDVLDGTATPIKTYDWDLLFSYEGSGAYEVRTDGYFTLDFNVLGYPETKYIYIRVPQSFSAIPTGYNTELSNFDYNVTWGYGQGTYDYKISSVSYGGIFRASMTVDIPDGTDAIYFSNLGDWYSNAVGFNRSHIIIYDSSDNLEDSAYLDDLNAEFGQFIYFPDYDTYDYDDVEYFILYLYTREWSSGYQTILDHNLGGGSSVNFEPDFVREVHYISQGIEIDTELISVPTTLDPNDPTPPTGFTFDRWYTSTGQVFDLNNITAELYPSFDIYLYAYYIGDTGTVSITPTDPTVETDNFFIPILTDWGWNTNTGYMLFFMGTMAIVTLFLIIIRVHLVGITLINFLILVLFTYWGLLPSYITIVGYVFFGVIGIISLAGIGGRSYE